VRGGNNQFVTITADGLSVIDVDLMFTKNGALPQVISAEHTLTSNWWTTLTISNRCGESARRWRH